eukprot:TRINITY_DN93646_c0_g1_i1.p1 TRINITY_DN93646_c0_g1~~TRINITY_DN93646_c0_g1_i1.p1  ORF type:complete len:166 (-),score=9.85 TRINITY_DN93646_c0_g1_i1:422-919(-)
MARVASGVLDFCCQGVSAKHSLLEQMGYSINPVALILKDMAKRAHLCSGTVKGSTTAFPAALGCSVNADIYLINFGDFRTRPSEGMQAAYYHVTDQCGQLTPNAKWIRVLRNMLLATILVIATLSHCLCPLVEDMVAADPYAYDLRFAKNAACLPPFRITWMVSQ